MNTIPFAALCPGEAFTKESTPFVTWVKVSHTWACVTWKGKTSHAPIHPTDPVCRTTRTNP